MDLPLLLAAAGFSVVAGANDGSTLIALNLENRALGPIASSAMLAVAIAVGPLLVGTGVATTVARGLVSFEGRAGSGTFLIAVLVAILVISVLSVRGLPTSLTLALTGGIVGAGIGGGLSVGWSAVAVILAIGLLAPMVSFLVAYLANRRLRGMPMPLVDRRQRIRVLQLGTFLAQCTAYASNDAQKMMAIAAVATDHAAGTVAVEPLTQVLIAGLFVLGLLLGVRRLAGRLGRRVMPITSSHLAAARLAASCAVFGSAALGAPVSMTQSSTAGLVGAGASDRLDRVRWQEVARIGLAWLLTLPAAAATAAIVSAVLRGGR